MATGKSSKQVLQGLIGYVQREQLKPGDRLPTERELAEILGASRPTVRKVLDRYAQCGAIRRLGRGGTILVEELDAAMVTGRDPSYVLSLVTPTGEDTLTEELQRRLQGWVLEAGFVLNPYFSGEDKQDLESEGRYLRSLFRVRPRGLLITASPFGETNARVIADLAASGIRVVHLHNFRDRLPDEEFHMPDWRYAGAMAVSLLARSNCARIVFANSAGQSPDMKVLRAGIAHALAMHRLPPLEEYALLSDSDKDRRLFSVFHDALPAHTGIVCAGALATQWTDAARARTDGKAFPPDSVIAIQDVMADSTPPPAVPCLRFSWEQRVKRVFDHFTASTTQPPLRELQLPILMS